MRHATLGRSDIPWAPVSYGCMRLAGTWNPAEVDAERRRAAFAALDAAYESGYTLFDHADIYGRGVCESLHGEYLQANPSLLARTRILTKGGIRRRDDAAGTVGRYDFSKQYLLDAVDASLRRLQVDCVDLYQLHRPDVLMDPREVADAFAEIHAAGKVRWFGVSNFLPWQFKMLQACCDMPLVVNQIEVHLGRLDPFFDGTLDQCQQHRVTPLSWSPLAGGWLGSAEPIEGREGLQDAMDRIGRAYGLDRAGVALAWLAKHPSGIIPIVGSIRPDRIAASARAVEAELTREHWYELLVASRGAPMP